MILTCHILREPRGVVVGDQVKEAVEARLSDARFKLVSSKSSARVAGIRRYAFSCSTPYVLSFHCRQW